MPVHNYTLCIISKECIPISPEGLLNIWYSIDAYFMQIMPVNNIFLYKSTKDL